MVVVFNATFSTFVAVSCVDGGNRSKVCYLCLLHTIFWIFSMFFFHANYRSCRKVFSTSSILGIYMYIRFMSIHLLKIY